MAIVDRRGNTVDATTPPSTHDPNPGLAFKAPVRAATTANVALTGLQTIDGIALAAGDRVLVKDQTDASDNGIYAASTGAWSRTVDLDSSSEVTGGTQVYVVEGTANGGTTWAVSSTGAIILETDDLDWARAAYARVIGALTAGAIAIVTAGGDVEASPMKYVAADDCYEWGSNPLSVPYIGVGFTQKSRIAIATGDLNDSTASRVWNVHSVYAANSGSAGVAAIVGTAVTQNASGSAWGLAGVGAALVSNASAYGAELNVIVGTGVSGANAWALTLACGVDGAGPYGQARGYLYVASAHADVTPDDIFVLHDLSRSPVTSNGSIIRTYGDGAGGTGTFHSKYGVNLLRTTIDTYPFVFGNSGTPLWYVDGSGATAFKGNAGLYAIDSSGTPVKLADHDAASTLSRFYGPAGSAHLQFSNTQVFHDATTHVWRSNDALSTFASLSSSGLSLTVALSAANGGTGLSSYAIGDLIYASAATPTLSKLAAVAAGALLGSAGANTAPTWLTAGYLSTSLRTPTVYGGAGTSSDNVLNLVSTSGNGSSDAVNIKGGNNGATTIATFTPSAVTVAKNLTVSTGSVTVSGGGQSGILIANTANNFSAFNTFRSLLGGSPVNCIMGISGDASNLLFTGAGIFNGAVGTSSNVGFDFATNNTVRMTLASSGELSLVPTTDVSSLSAGGAAVYTAGGLAVAKKILGGSSILSNSATGGIGYGAGAGGAVTQETSRSTGVTLNKASGDITLFSAAGSMTPTSFTVTNSAVAATDTIDVVQKSGTDKYSAHVTAVGAGSFEITFWTTGGTTTEQPVFHFNVIKGVAA